MKKTLFGLCMAIFLFFLTSPIYAAGIQIMIDGTVIPSDVSPEIINNRTMVPVRVVSENIGATVEWSNSKVTITKGDMKVILTLNSTTIIKNGEKALIDVKPYKKNNRVFVPLRFIAETFGYNVGYSKGVVTVDTEALFINGKQVSAFQLEGRMTMGSIVQQIQRNDYIETIYNIFMDNNSEHIKEPTDYYWDENANTLGMYLGGVQYDFVDKKGDSLIRLNVYTLNGQLPPELVAGSPKVLIHDVFQNKWYVFSDSAMESINQLYNTAEVNGYLITISNTVV